MNEFSDWPLSINDKRTTNGQDAFVHHDKTNSGWWTKVKDVYEYALRRRSKFKEGKQTRFTLRCGNHNYEQTRDYQFII